jgi:hypothetical protein
MKRLATGEETSEKNYRIDATCCSESSVKEPSMNNLGNKEHSNDRNVAIPESECDPRIIVQ